MATVTHDGRTVVTNSEGGWVFKPGVRGNSMEMRKLARAKKRKAIEMAGDGCQHSLSVDFEGSSSAFQSFRNRIANLYDGTIGTLTVPNEGSFDGVLFVGTPQLSEKVPTSEGHLYTLDLTLEEL